MSSPKTLKKVYSDQSKLIVNLQKHLKNLNQKNNTLKSKSVSLYKEVDQAYQFKLSKQQLKQTSRFQDQDQEQKIQALRYQNFIKKKQRELELEQVRTALIEMKKKEYINLTKIKQQNHNFITKNQESRIQENIDKKYKIKEQEQQSKDNYKQFWVTKLSSFDQTRTMKSLEMERSVEKNIKTLTKLERMEQDKLQSLRESKLYIKKGKQQLKDVQMLPIEKYQLKYTR